MTPNLNGLLRPHGFTLSLLHRFLDAAIIMYSLELCGRLFGIQLHPLLLLAGGWAAMLFFVFGTAKGMYGSWRVYTLYDEAINVARVWVGVICALLLLAFFTKTSADFSRLAIFTWFVVAPASLIATRVILRVFLRNARKQGRNTRSVAFAGAGSVAEKLAEKIQESPWMGLRVDGLYDDRNKTRLMPLDLPLLGNLAQLVEDARSGKIDYVYITLPINAETRVMQLVSALADSTASVYVVPNFFVFDLLHAQWSSVGTIPVVSVFDSPFYGGDGWLKRLEDICLSSLFLAIATPLMLLIAIGVKLTPGPIIFRQHRYGLNGQIIEVWKFRSMTVCENGASIAQATLGDARVTAFGAFLRRSSLDELPQLLNVLQGKMSLVGPRPHAVAHNEHYRRLIHGYMLRHKIKPGMTGWAQINGWRGETDTLEKMQKRVEFDLFYIRNWSLWLDIKIIWLTVFNGFFGKNAY